METKKEYRVLKPIGLGGRKEVGEIVEMTDKQFRAFDDGYLQPLEPVNEAVTTAKAGETAEKVDTDSAVKPQRRRRVKKEQ